jgi:hypothetical protein
MALDPRVPDAAPANPDYQQPISRHRRDESYAVRANSILGGMHHALLRINIAANQKVIEAADAIPAVPVGLKQDAMLPVGVGSAMVF